MRPYDQSYRLLFSQPRYVYLLIEFQSEVQRFMAVRLLAYVALLYQDLIARKELTPSGELPLVLPIVLYNGEDRWWAPLEPSELIQAVPEEARPYVPRLRYRLIDEGSYSREELEDRQNLAGALLACDLVYNPQETLFLREARAAGCQVLGGLPMLVRQGAQQFRLWTGRDAPEQIMQQAASAALAAESDINWKI